MSSKSQGLSTFFSEESDDAFPIRTILFALLLAATAIGVRLVFFSNTNEDVFECFYPWYDFLNSHGYRGMSEAFSNYTPAYMYLLYASTVFDGLAPKLALMKASTLPFDLAAGYVAYGVAALRFPRGWRPWAAAAGAMLAPTLVVDDGRWAQIDILYAMPLLAMVLEICRNRPVRAMLWFALALSFKFQAIFLAPFVLAMLLRGALRWRDVPLVPLLYLALAIPVLLIGRPLGEVLTIYLGQADLFHELTMNAANLYVFAPDRAAGLLLPVGIAVTGAAALAYAWIVGRSRTPLTVETVLLAATVSAAAMPFLLPRMHERYFIQADLLSIPLAVVDPRFWFVPLLLQLTGLLAYLPFDTGSYGVGTPWTAGLPPAALTNALLVAFLALRLWERFRTPSAAPRPTPWFGRGLAAVWLGYGAWQLCLLAGTGLGAAVTVWPRVPTGPRGLLALTALTTLAFLAVHAAGRWSAGPRSRVPAPSPPQPG